MASVSALIFVYLVSFCFISVSCQVLVPNKVAEGQPFTFYCEARDVLFLHANEYYVYQLRIYRRGTTNLTQVAKYSYQVDTPFKFDTISHDGRNWTFNIHQPKDKEYYIIQTWSIVWEVFDAKCEDAGEYVCDMYYPTQYSKGHRYTTSGNLTVTGEPSRFSLSSSPHSSDLLYREGDNITLTCNIAGPFTLKFEWKKWAPSSSDAEQFESLPSDAVIVKTIRRSPFGDGYCSDNDLQSKLTFRIDAKYEHQTYKCIVSNIRQEMESGNITIGILPLERPIVDAKDPRDVETFTITCDASRVTIPHSEGRAVSISELVLEARVGSSQTFDKIAQYVACGPPGRLEYQNKIPGRDWVFNFTGSKCGESNMATMRIEIQVRDPKHTDAGLYRCTVRYFSAQSGLVEVSQEYNLTTRVLPIVNEEIRNKRALQMVKCDARRVEVPGPNISSEVVGALVIQAKFGQSQTYTKIAEYFSYGPQENLQFQHPPPGRDWVFTFAGSNNGVNNRKTMSLDIETRCDDGGTYLCQVMFYSSVEGAVWLQHEQNVTAVCY